MHYAGFWRRTVALIVDVVLIFIVWLFILPMLDTALGIGLLGYLTERMSDTLEIHPGDFGQLFPLQIGILLVLAGLAAIVSYLIYSPILESSRIQATVGKMLLGIIVTDIEGQRISLQRASMRSLCKLASVITFLIAFIIVCFTTKRQAIHDIVTGCLVLEKK
jgi:uncharacterized RDD family membrane protein YckC